MKYYLSLCCIIKDERYIEEFIVYYRILGVEHFYIYDNESARPLSERLSKPFYQNMCTIIPFPGKIQQMNAYNHCVNNYRNDTKWLIIVDGDEFILPKKENHWSLRDFLNEYEDAQAIGINWKMFGSNFHNEIQDGFHIEKYTRCENNQGFLIKTICQPRFVHNVPNPHYVNVHDPSKYIDPHRRVISGPINHNYTIDIIQINHYWLKSAQDQIEKHNRGFADQLGKRDLIQDPHSLFNDTEERFIVDKYLDALKSVFEEHSL